MCKTFTWIPLKFLMHCWIRFHWIRPHFYPIPESGGVFRNFLNYKLGCHVFDILRPRCVSARRGWMGLRLSRPADFKEIEFSVCALPRGARSSAHACKRADSVTPSDTFAAAERNFVHCGRLTRGFDWGAGEREMPALLNLSNLVPLLTPTLLNASLLSLVY